MLGFLKSSLAAFKNILDINMHGFEFVVINPVKWTPGSFPWFLPLLISTEVIILRLVGVESKS